ncbi:hypothetical protein [Dictyobacter aurantiacus]|nr:hypothetical protein [Dictyobacter aurantiacus]
MSWTSIDPDLLLFFLDSGARNQHWQVAYQPGADKRVAMAL